MMAFSPSWSMELNSPWAITLASGGIDALHDEEKLLSSISKSCFKVLASFKGV